MISTRKPRQKLCFNFFLDSQESKKLSIAQPPTVSLVNALHVTLIRNGELNDNCDDFIWSSFDYREIYKFNGSSVARRGFLQPEKFDFSRLVLVVANSGESESKCLLKAAHKSCCSTHATKSKSMVECSAWIRLQRHHRKCDDSANLLTCL